MTKLYAIKLEPLVTLHKSNFVTLCMNHRVIWRGGFTNQAKRTVTIGSVTFFGTKKKKETR